MRIINKLFIVTIIPYYDNNNNIDNIDNIDNNNEIVIISTGQLYQCQTKLKGYVLRRCVYILID